ncbi:uncharacterized protein LOC141850921 [Brevipalpus obovatus]|uniref:uncharacterized protein LOC141850921 n=1 Tax=Brevipalpus obovatus TaxID=246614 RepID=UPI003D9F03DB
MKDFFLVIFLIAFVLISSQNVHVNAETYTNFAKYQVLCTQIKQAWRKTHFVPENIVRGFTNLVRSELIHNRGAKDDPRMIKQTVVSEMQQCFPTSQPVLYYDSKSGRVYFKSEIKQHPYTHNGYVGIFAKDQATIDSTDPINVQQSQGKFKNTVFVEESTEAGLSRISKLAEPEVENGIQNGAKKP